jgi:hypothetical protein
MGYRTVFDITQGGLQWWIPLLAFICGTLFSGIGWALRKCGDNDSITKGTFFQIVGFVGLLGGLAFFASMFGEYRDAKGTLESHSYSVAEGEVSDFVPMPPGGHATESFTLNGVRFEYVNSEWNKGYVHNGVNARITYKGKDIIKVEVK